MEPNTQTGVEECLQRADKKGTELVGEESQSHGVWEGGGGGRGAETEVMKVVEEEVGVGDVIQTDS